jgi:membrane protease YdiL (CAAX protease family)
MKIPKIKDWTPYFIISLSFLLVLLSLNFLKICIGYRISDVFCSSFVAKISIIGNILLVLGGFLLLKQKEITTVKEGFKLFEQKTGLDLSIEKKKFESILYGTLIGILVYFILYSNPQTNYNASVYLKLIKFLSAIILAPFIEEVFYRGIIILGGYNFVIFSQRLLKKDWIKFEDRDFLLLAFLIISTLYFGKGHSNPMATLKGLIYGFLFLYRKNILMPWSAHVTNNFLAFIFEEGIVEYPF